jgi:adenylylsulfate kinase
MDNSAGRNIFFQDGKVSYEDRCAVLGQKGLVVWFTGLSGSGKTTIACEVEKRLSDSGRAVYLLDGDRLRKGINADLGFSEEDRNENIRRAAEVAALFREAGLIVLCSFISPYVNMRKFARSKAGEGRFLEVYVKADIETCAQRDPKGLYKKGVDEFTGVTSPYEVPENPDLVVDTTVMTVEECTQMVFQKIAEMPEK